MRIRVTSVWKVTGTVNERAPAEQYLVADTFEEAARLAPAALVFGWGQHNAPPVVVESVTLAQAEVRVAV